MVFSFGSIACSFVKDHVKTEQSPTKPGLDVFVADAQVFEVPVNHIGFHSYPNVVAVKQEDEIQPVANAPPDTL